MQPPSCGHEVKRNGTLVQEVIREIFLDNVALAAQQDQKAVYPLLGVDFHTIWPGGFHIRRRKMAAAFEGDQGGVPLQFVAELVNVLSRGIVRRTSHNPRLYRGCAMKQWWKLALAAVILGGCGSDSRQINAFSPNGPSNLQVGLPPALPGKITSVDDPFDGENEDLSSPDDATFQVRLQPGWNAVAFQVDFVTQIVAGPEVVGFTTYENGEYLPPEPLTTDTVNRGEGTSLGFFIYANAPTTLTYRGTPERGADVAGLEPGWNLVAPPVEHLADLIGSVQVFEVSATAETESSDGEAEMSLPVWVYSPVALEWKKAAQPGPNRQMVVTTHAPAPSTKDYPESHYVCDELLPEEDGVRPLAFYRGLRWSPGQTLNVLFLDGDQIPENVYTAAIELIQDSWQANSSLRFHFETGEPDPNLTYHIKVTFLVDKGYN